MSDTRAGRATAAVYANQGAVTGIRPRRTEGFFFFFFFFFLIRHVTTAGAALSGRNPECRQKRNAGGPAEGKGGESQRNVPTARPAGSHTRQGRSAVARSGVVRNAAHASRTATRYRYRRTRQRGRTRTRCHAAGRVGSGQKAKSARTQMLPACGRGGRWR